ncbi:MAG: aminotransferase class I/II-fold pyridoxal phosphate-dependent enzyme [Proteobacteria bacterium]|nr:aminotransferase class I/II-fold pyridoxal phosphate-dependent enzyme [Pseudomonadota bacterium]
MLNPRFQQLPDHTWTKLRALLTPLTPGRNDTLDLSLGEPKHAMPSFIGEVLRANEAGYSKYPPIQGTPDWQAAVGNWLGHRYGIDVDPHAHVLPVAGTREGLFNAAFIAVPDIKAGKQPLVLMPNPFYQCYAAAALAAGAEPRYLPATRETGFLPDFRSITEEDSARTALVYLCSPANPQGSVADTAFLEVAISQCRQHDAVLIVDECYSEIYTDMAPTGVLEVCRDMVTRGAGNAANPFANVLAFHSLSKRSNLPGLRSGFVAGDPSLIAAYRELRAYGGAPSPIPVYAAAAAAWSDETHVEENRALYRAKFDAADRILGDRFGHARPGGGFFLWLDVRDGQDACRRLWTEGGVRVVPGAYLARSDSAGYNPGAPYIRVALVQPQDTTEEALTRLVSILG